MNRKYWLLILLLFFNISKVFPQNLHSILGIFDRFENGVLTVHEDPLLSYRIPAKKSLPILGSSNQQLSPDWLIPGDGVRIILDQNQRAVKILSSLTWYFGTVAFASPQRLTLLEGYQFFVQNAPVYLNGEEIKPALLTPPQEVLIRFDNLHQRVVGVWAFQFNGLKKESNILATQTTVSKGILHVLVRTRAPGKVAVQLLGVTQRMPIFKKSKWLYQGSLVIPREIALPRSYLSVQYNHEIQIYQVPISLYTKQPIVVETGPSYGSHVPVNPPFIFASFDPRNTLLDFKSIKIMLDHVNVTQNCYVNSSHIFYTPEPLRPGMHRCVLTGFSQGHTASFYKTWFFYVDAPGGHHVSHLSKNHPCYEICELNRQLAGEFASKCGRKISRYHSDPCWATSQHIVSDFEETYSDVRNRD